MKNVLRLSLLIATLVAPSVSLAAKVDDAHGPSCADWKATVDYRPDLGGQAVLTYTVGTESGEPTCADARYVVTVRNIAGSVAATTTLVGDGVASVFQGSLNVSENPSPVTVTIESFRKSKNSLDSGTSPSLFLDGPAGATDFR
jgi:hypothetical protein